MSSFRQVVLNLQQGQREEAMIGLEFVLRIDPAFSPAVGLQHQLKSGAEEIDLSDIVAQLEAPSTDAINEMLVEAVEAFSQRNFVDAKSMVEKVLIELPGHQEARQLLNQIDESLKLEQQVGQFLAQAREALANGDPQEAANFVMMAQALDPHHTGITSTLQEIYAEGGVGPQREAAEPAGGPFATPATPPPSGDAFPAQAESGWSPGDAHDISFDDQSMGEVPAEDDFEFPLLDEQPDAPIQAPETLTERVDEAFGEAPVAALPADDVSDLFDAGPGTEPSEIPEETSEVGELVARGMKAYRSGLFLEAIDSWSRVFLVEPSNNEVPKLISEAKKELEETRRQVEHLLFDAEDAVIGGDKEKALELVDQILAKYPGHPEATELHQRLTGTAAVSKPPRPAPAAEALPDLEDDLFSEPFGEADAEPAAVPEEESFDELSFDDELADFLPDDEAPPTKRLLGVPVRTLAVAGVAVALLLAVGWFGVRPFLGGGGGSSEDVYAIKAEAEALFKEGKVGAALSLVERFEPADEIDRQLINMLAEKYRAALATPTPTPIPALAQKANEWMAAGLWFRAYNTAMEGLASYPSDGGLLELIEEIEALEPRAKNLRTQIGNGNHRSAVMATRDLLETYPAQSDLGAVYERSLYNAALAELRTYNLTGAATYLDELHALDGEDAEVIRVLDFIANYKARPVDMQLKVFIQSLGERSDWGDPPEPVIAEPQPAEVAAPTPTPDAAAG